MGEEQKKELKQGKRELFKMTEEVDRAIKHLDIQAVLLVGQTRKGKSTVLNWISNTPLLALKQNEKMCYKVLNDAHSEVAIGHGYQSCTLVPNIYKGSNICVADTAGFGDSVNYIRVLGVSYALQALFDHLQKVKFILVVEETELKDGNGKGFCESLNYFLNMFDLSNLEESDRIKIYRSVTLLINFSKQQTRHLTMLTRIRDQLSNPKLKKIENRKYIVQFLKELIYQNRFGNFDEAIENCSPDPCGLFEEMASKKWQFLQLNNESRQKMILLPMSEEFQDLQDDEQSQFVENITFRIDSYKIAARSIFGILNANLVNNDITNVGNIIIPYDSFHNFLLQYLKDHDDYDSDKLLGLNEAKGKVYSKLAREKLLLEIIKIKNCFKSIGQDVLSIDTLNAVQQFHTIQLALKEFCDRLVNIFVRDQKQHRLLLRLRFIFLRGIRQFLMLRKVASKSPSSNSKLKGIENSAYYQIRQTFQSQNNIQENIRDFIYLFKDNIHDRIKLLVKCMDNPVQRYIKSRQAAYNIQYILIFYEKVLLQYLQNSKSEYNIVRATYYRIQRDIKIIHARYEYDEGNYSHVISQLIDAFRGELTYESYRKDYLADESYQEQRDKKEKREMLLNQESILIDILYVLIKLKQLNLALELARHLKMHDQICNIYEEMLEKDKSVEKFNKGRVLEYAEFCFQINRFQKGLILYQKVCDAQNEKVEDKKVIMNDLAKRITLREKYAEQYREYLQNFQLMLLEEERRRQIVNKIQMTVLKDSVYFKKLDNLLKKAFFSTNISLQNSMLDESYEIKNVNERIFEEQFSKVLLDNKILGIQVQMTTILQRLDKPTYLITINSERDLMKFNQAFLDIYPRLVSKAGVVLYIDVNRIKLNHYLTTQKYLMIKFQRAPTESIPYQIKLYKFLKKLIYQNVDNSLQQAKQAFYIFYKEAIEKVRELSNYFQESIEVDDLLQILKAIIENEKGQLDKSKIKMQNQKIPNQIADKVIEQWQKFTRKFMENQRQGTNVMKQYEEYSDILYFSDF